MNDLFLSSPPLKNQVRGPWFLVVVLLMLPLAGRADPPGKNDPFPIRRIIIPPERLPTELHLLKRGELRDLSRREFEERVRKAAQPAGPAQPPRLLRARYRGRLEGTALRGSGDWNVINPATGPQLLPLSDLRLPLRQVKLENQPAILAEFDHGQALLLEKTGTQVVYFDWSLAGREVPGELHFDLQVPACAAASLELTLPAEFLLLVSPSAGLVFGPEEAGNAGQRLWQVEFSGKPHVNLVLRRSSGPGALAPLHLVHLHSRQQLYPDHVQVEYRCQIEVLHSSVRQLVFDWPAALVVQEVTCGNLELSGWDTPAGTSTLVVDFRQPVQGQLPLLRIMAQGMLRPGKQWQAVGLRLQQSLVRAETLEVLIHPDLQLENFKAGSFRLLRSNTDHAGLHVLSLAESGAAKVIRPSGLVQGTRVELTTEQRSWWQLGPRDSTLHVEVDCEVRRGTQFQLALWLPRGWKEATQVEEVELQPRDLLRSWVTVLEKDRRLLLVELQRGLSAGNKVALRLRLRSPLTPLPPAGRVLDFPEVELIDRASLARYGITVDPALQAQVLTSAFPPILFSREQAGKPAGPWGKEMPGLYFVHRQEPLAGQLHVRPRSAQVSIRASSEVVLAGQRGQLRTTLILEPVEGSPEFIDLLLTAPLAGPLRLLSPGVPGTLERQPVREFGPDLLLLASRTPWEVLGWSGIQLRLESWRLRLARPLARQETLVLEAPLEPSLPAVSETQIWEIPLVLVEEATLRGEVRGRLGGMHLLRAQVQGMQATAPGGGQAQQDFSALGYEYQVAGTGRLLPRLWWKTRPLAPATVSLVPQEVCDRARLTTHVSLEGRTIHHLVFEVAHWRKQTLPLLLPAGVEILGGRVQGRWLDRLPQAAQARGLLVELPVPTDQPRVQLEVVYAQENVWPSWAVFLSLDLPWPQLPVAPLSFQHRWCLPPDVVPLFEGNWQRLPDPEHLRPSPWKTLRQGWQAADQLWRRESGSADLWVEEQLSQLRRAEQELRDRAGRPERLGALLAELERLFVKTGKTALVVDAAALRSAGVNADSPCDWRSPQGPWSALGLVPVPCRAGILLTTQWQLQRWRLNLEEKGRRPLFFGDGPVEEAVRQASERGQDSSGEFLRGGVWLQQQAESDLSWMSFWSSRTADGSEWEPVAGTEPGTLWVVRYSQLKMAGWVLGGLIVLLTACWARRLKARGRLRLMLLWAGVAGTSLMWTPVVLYPCTWWPAVAATVVTLLVYLGGTEEGKQPRSGRTFASVGSSVALLLMGIFLRPATAGGLDSATVWIVQVPSAEDRVFVPADLLTRLDNLVRRGGVSTATAVIVNANYEGTVQGTRFDGRAEFQIYCLSDDATIHLPRGEIELKEAPLLEGAQTFPLPPVVAPEGQTEAAPNGFTLPIQGRKGHLVSLTLYFSCRIRSQGDNRELFFPVPQVNQSQLTVTFSERVQGVVALTALGEQQFGKQKDNFQLRAHLGLANRGRADSAVQVRWRSSGPVTEPLRQAAEYHLWELRPPAASLTSVFRYTLSRGAVQTLLVELPPDYQVRSLEIERLETSGIVSAAGVDPPPQIRSWRQFEENKKNYLEITLNERISGQVQLILGLVGQTPLVAGSYALIPPAPAQTRMTGGLLAYLLEGVEVVESPQQMALTDVRQATFVKEWRELGLREPAGFTRAFTFRRLPGISLLRLKPVPLQLRAHQDLLYKVDPRHADLTATLTLSGAQDLPGFVEWEVPPAITLERVSGPALHRWAHSGSRLQLWLREPQKQVALKVEGWLRSPSSLPAGLGGAIRWQLPVIRPIGPIPVTSVFNLTTPAEYELVAEKTQHLQWPKGPREAAVTDRADYSGTFRIRPVVQAPIVRRLSCLEVREGLQPEEEFTALFFCELPSGFFLGPARLQLELATADLRDVQVQALGAQIQAQPATRPGGGTWTIQPSRGMPQPCLIRLNGKRPGRAGSRFDLPQVTLSGGQVLDHWIAVAGDGLTVAEATGVQPVGPRDLETSNWPAEAQRWLRRSKLWRVTATNWRLPLVLRSSPMAPALQILSLEQRAALADGQHWVYQAECWLAARRTTELHLDLPGGAQLLGVTVNGVPTPVRQLANEHLAISLLDSSVPIRLGVTWRFAAGSETPLLPRLRTIGLRGLPVPEILWSVAIPPGQRVRGTSDESSTHEISPAQLQLHRAEVLLRGIALQLHPRRDQTDDSSPQLDRWWRWLAWQCGQVEQLLVASPTADVLAQKLAALKQKAEQLARQHQCLPQLQAAFQQPVIAPALGEQLLFPGRPGEVKSWRTATNRPPVLVLEERELFLITAAVAGTELLLAVVLGGMLLSYLPMVTQGLRRLGPEMLLLLGLLGSHAFGLSLLGILLIAVAVLVRLLLLVGAFRACLGQVGKPAAPASGNSAG